MSLWWLWGTDTSTVGDAEVNYPSLWSGGVTWEAADSGTGTQGYWQTTVTAAARTGAPDISIAVGGEPLRHTIHNASWQGGRSEWLSVLPPGSASFSVEGAVTYDPMTEVVFGVMSDTTDAHSPSLWVGYVDTLSETHETSGRIVTSVSCIDVVGRLGQSPAPVGDVDDDGAWTVKDAIERIARLASLPLEVIDESLSAGVNGPTGAFDDGESALSAINRIESGGNLNLFLRGDGKLVVIRRWYFHNPDTDPAPDVVALSGAAATWTVGRSLTHVINDWGADYPPNTPMLASQDVYGQRTYSIPDGLAGAFDVWSSAIYSAATGTLRPLLASADFPVTDLGDAVLFVDPGDWVSIDSETYQVLSVQHSVEPGHQWRVSITGDQTQVALHEEFDT